MSLPQIDSSFDLVGGILSMVHPPVPNSLVLEEWTKISAPKRIQEGILEGFQIPWKTQKPPCIKFKNRILIMEDQ